MPSPVADPRSGAPALKALTPLRFFAAIYVVLFHLHVGFGVSRVPLVSRFMASGYTGVTLFFVLSGFILAYNYPEVRSAREFWVARFARIYPVYAVSLLLSLIRPAVLHEPHLLAGCLLDFGLLQAWWVPLFAAINSAAWTLSVEAFFYAMFPLLLPALRTMRSRVFWQLQAAYLVFLCTPVLLGFSRFAHLGMQLAGIIEGPFPLFRLNTFAVGVFVGSRFLARARERRLEQKGRTWQSNLGLSIVVLFSVGLLCLAPSSAWLPVRTLLLTYAFTWLIVELADIAWPVLTNRWMQFAGEISYGIYILQFPVGLMVDGLWRRLVSNAPDPLLLHVAAILFAAGVSFRWFETPARLAIRRVLMGYAAPVHGGLVMSLTKEPEAGASPVDHRDKKAG